MDIQALTDFFKWCTIINGSILIIWSVLCMSVPNSVYKIQARWFPIQREPFDLSIFYFLGLFKILFIVFNVTPFLALVITG